MCKSSLVTNSVGTAVYISIYSEASHCTHLLIFHYTLSSRDWYERQQRQRTFKKNAIGIAVIEYEDGEQEMVDLRAEKFRSCRSEDDDASNQSEGEDDEEDDSVNNFELIAEGEWIKIFWKHVKIYFPCKIVSWSPLRSEKRSNPSRMRESEEDDVRIESETTMESRNTQETSKATPQRPRRDRRVASHNGHSTAAIRDNYTDSVAPAEKPSKQQPPMIEPRIQRERRVKHQSGSVAPATEAIQRVVVTPNPIEDEVPSSLLKHQQLEGDVILKQPEATKEKFFRYLLPPLAITKVPSLSPGHCHQGEIPLNLPAKPPETQLSRSKTLVRSKQHDTKKVSGELCVVEKIVNCKIVRNGAPICRTGRAGYSVSDDTSWEQFENVVSTGHA